MGRNLTFIYVILPFYLDDNASEERSTQLSTVQNIDVERINQLSKNVTFLVKRLVSNTILRVVVNMSQNV